MTSSCAERRRRALAGLAGALLYLANAALLWPLPIARAHVPVPDSILNPQSAPEAWNVLRLAVANIGRLVGENRLGEVIDQASLCSPALRTLARLADGMPQQTEVATVTLRVSSAMHSLTQACVACDRASVGSALERLHAALGALAAGTDPRTVNADVFLCPMHPEVTSLDGGALCPKCGMALVPRRIPYSFVYVAPPGEPSMHMTASSDAPLQAGRPTRVRVRFTKKDGSPVAPTDLLVAHTQKIHLLIVDSALEDYHHEHPTPTGSPGEYEFAFTPANTRPYRVYADVVPALTGIQEYLPADLPAAPGTTPPEGRQAIFQSQFDAEAGGLKFRLVVETADRSPHAGQTCALQVTVSSTEGEPFAKLEPVMNAFAHLVGFYDDRQTVVHLHPAGPEVLDEALRGGPDLRFVFYPPKSGLLRLYCQVQVDGRQIFAPFALSVAP